MRGGHLVVAHHGCDATTRDALVSGRLKHLDQSNNPYDWLGPGVYFFEDDPDRARLFAQSSAENPDKQYTRRPIATPAVVGAVLCVGTCLDMTTQAGIAEFNKAYEFLRAMHEKAGKPLPKNKRAGADDQDIILRKLDRAVFAALHQKRDEIRVQVENGSLDRASLNPEDYLSFDMVRGAFMQGEPAVPASTFRSRSHVQLALRNPKCVLGWFLPPGEKLMTEAERREAEERQAALLPAAGKP